MESALVKRNAVAVIALALLALPAPSGVFAQIQEPATVRDGIDVKLGNVIADIVAFQAAEAGKSGEFYQTLWTHSEPPADGALVVPDRLYSFPSDQIGKSAQAQWDAVKLPAALEARYRVDVYDGPKGKGFVVILQSQLDGATWQKSLNYGPETYRDQEWIEMTERIP